MPSRTRINEGRRGCTHGRHDGSRNCCGRLRRPVSCVGLRFTCAGRDTPQNEAHQPRRCAPSVRYLPGGRNFAATAPASSWANAVSPGVGQLLGREVAAKQNEVDGHAGGPASSEVRYWDASAPTVPMAVASPLGVA
jgi:hypothetical protein